MMVGLLAAVLLPASAASADVDDFSYSSWEAHYAVSLDDDGRAVAHVTETLVAEFPDADQNKGIVRGYPERYEGAGISLDIVSVKDADGQPMPYETESDDGMLYVLTGDDDYVHGATTYVIEYTMRDFMVTGSKSHNDEFYWDLLPLDSTQPIDRVDIELSFFGALAHAFTGDSACYEGGYGSSRRCDLDGPRTDGDAQVFRVTSGERDAGDGITLAIGFDAGTVTQPAARQPDPVADFGAAGFGAGALALLTGSWFAVARLARKRRIATGIIVAQFDVPDELEPLTAAALIPRSPNPIPAELVHLAVQGAVRLEEEADSKRPSVRLLDREAVTAPLDLATLDAVFTGGSRLRVIPRTNEKFAKRMTKLAAKGKAAAKTHGWVTTERSRAAMALAGVGIALLLGAVALLVWNLTLDRDMLPLSVAAVIFTFTAAVITSFVAFGKHTVLTRDGAERYEYLMGLKEFIRVAEADRMRMLQSYQGAERRSDGQVDVVHLYEKLLPYAMLFGEEKTWTQVLQTAYDTADTHPIWIAHAANISIGANLSRYSQSVRSAASYSASSSSSGGSMGGGFSGGGGGGGFSGGR